MAKHTKRTNTKKPAPKGAVKKARTVKKKPEGKAGKRKKGKPKQIRKTQIEKLIDKRKAFVEAITDEQKLPGRNYEPGEEPWLKRSTRGRKAIFETPAEMLEACYEYFEYQTRQVLNKVDYKGKDAIRVEIPTSAPFSIHSLCLFLGVNTKYFNDFRDGLKKRLKSENEKERQQAAEFSEVITHVTEIIYVQKYEGAVANIYNANIISRDLGLADKKELLVAEQPLFPEDIKD